MIQFQSLRKAYGEQILFSDLNLTLDRGFLVFGGPSGCGKTTLCRIAAGLEKPDHGKVSGVTGRPAVLFQEPRLLPSLSAVDNVACVSKKKNGRNAASALLMLLGFSVADLSKKPPALSGGMQQRVALARLILFASEYEGNLVVLDEPFRGLDPETKKKAAELLAGLADRAVLLITHDAADAALFGVPYHDFDDIKAGAC